MTKFGSKQILIASIAVLLSSYVAYAAGLASSVMAARALGPDEYGKFAYFVWLTGIIVIIFNNGITVTLIRYVSESIGENNEKRARSQERWLKNLLWICIGIIGTGCLLRSSHLGLELQKIPEALAAFILISAAAAKSIYIFDVSKSKGYGEFNVEPRSTTILSILSVLLTLILFLRDEPILYYVGAFVLISLIHPFLSRSLIENSGKLDDIDRNMFKPDLPFLKHLFWSGLLCVVALSTNRAMETYLLNAHFRSAEVAKFIVAATLSRAGLDLVSVGLNAVLMPVLGHGLGNGGQAQVDKITQNAIKYMYFLGLLFAGFCFFIADPLVAILYGNSYAESALAFKVLIVTGGLTLSSGVFGAYLSTSSHQKQRAIIAVVGAVIQGLAAIFAVPRFGLWGAVASTSIGIVASISLLYYICVKKVGLQLPVQNLSRGLLLFFIISSALQIICLRNPADLTNIIAGFAFGIIFIILSFPLKFWDKSDILIIKSIFPEHSKAHSKASRFFNYLDKYLS